MPFGGRFRRAAPSWRVWAEAQIFPPTQTTAPNKIVPALGVNVTKADDPRAMLAVKFVPFPPVTVVDPPPPATL